MLQRIITHCDGCHELFAADRRATKE